MSRKKYNALTDTFGMVAGRVADAYTKKQVDDKFELVVQSTDEIVDSKTYHTNDLFIYNNRIYKTKNADNGITGSAIKSNLSTYADATTIGNEVSELNNKLSGLKFETGSVLTKSGNTGEADITFKQSYSINPVVVGTLIATSGTGFMVTIKSVSKTGCTLVATSHDGTHPSGGNSIYYVVVGV